MLTPLVLWKELSLYGSMFFVFHFAVFDVDINKQNKKISHISWNSNYVFDYLGIFLDRFIIFGRQIFRLSAFL